MKIEYIFYDFDGVMTNNKVLIDGFGNELVEVNRSDGLAISEIKKLGIGQAIISTETNNVVSKRALKLKIPCLQGIKDKKKALKEYCLKEKVDIKYSLFVGNDLNDFEVMNSIGYAICPSDAYKDIIKISDHVLKSKGGQGVIREILDLINKGEIVI